MGHHSVGDFIGVLEARSRCSGISAAADSTSPFFLCLQSPDCLSFLFFLGSVFSYHFVSTCKLMTAGIHPPITINMTFLCMPAVSSWERYILVFRLLSFHGRQGGRFIAAFSFLDNFFVPGIPHVVILCVWLLSVLVSSMAVPIHCQPLRSEASEGQSCHCPEAGGRIPRLVLILWLSPCSLG